MTLDRYARGYAEVARLQGTFAKILSAHGITASMARFEADVDIDAEVLRGAAKRAESEGRELVVVTRALLFQAACEAVPDPDYDPFRRPPFRPRGTERSRLRFWIPRGPYNEAKRAIERSRCSVSQALENQLRRYVEEGLPNDQPEGSGGVVPSLSPPAQDLA